MTPTSSLPKDLEDRAHQWCINRIPGYIPDMMPMGWSASVRESLVSEFQSLLEQRNGMRCAVPGRSEWVPIETAPKMRTLLLGYRNSLGKWRTVKGCYYVEGSLDWHDSLPFEPDTDYAPAGWYEESETHDDILPLDGDQAPTHWMPLPSPPGSVQHSAALNNSKDPVTREEK